MRPMFLGDSMLVGSRVVSQRKLLAQKKVESSSVKLSIRYLLTKHCAETIEQNILYFLQFFLKR